MPGMVLIMMASPTNPYRPTIGHKDVSHRRFTWRNLKLFALLGAVVGVCLPIGFGTWLIYSVWSQPQPPPGQALCGMPVLGGMFAILIGAPVGGVLIAASGVVVGAMCDIVIFFLKGRVHPSSPGADVDRERFSADRASMNHKDT